MTVRHLYLTWHSGPVSVRHAGGRPRGNAVTLCYRMGRLLVLAVVFAGLVAGATGCESTSGGDRSVGSDGHAGHNH